jgi:hypothetical protein
MNANQIKEVAQELREIAQNVTAPDSSDVLNFYSHDDFSYGLNREYAARLNKQIQEIFDHEPYAKRFSKKFISKKLRKIIVKSFENEDLSFENELQLLDRELENFQDSQEIYLAVDGLILNQCFILGDIKFTPGDDCFLDFIQDKFQSRFEKGKRIEHDKLYLENLRNDIDQEFRGSCVAIISVIGERDRAYEIAKEETRRAVDLLRYTARLFARGNDIRIGLRGDYPRSFQRSLIFSEKNYWLKSESIGANRFEINQNVLDAMKKIGVFKLADDFSKEDLSEFKEAIFKSIHWLSIACIQDKKDNALLYLVIALESLFKQREGKSIQATIVDSVVLILSDQISSHREVIKKIKDLYSKRSGIAHGGTSAAKNITDSDLRFLTQVVVNVIERCLIRMDDFESREELANWNQDPKLS